MANGIRILTTEFDGDDGLIVTFSDGTTGAYVVEELLELRPIRERTKTKIAAKAKAKSYVILRRATIRQMPSVTAVTAVVIAARVA